MDRPPRLLERPNPFTTPRVFFRDTAFYLATRGEAWWWIAARDLDGLPLSLYPIKPWEIVVEPNPSNRLEPTIRWGQREIPLADVRQITYLPGSDERGRGPLQELGAAVSVSIESQEWAASFFDGSIPSIVGTTDQDMTEDELELMDRQWNEKAPNLPRWLTNGLTLSESPFDPEKAQLTQTRQHQVGDIARAFSMPGSLLEYQMSGSTLRYQNDQSIWRDFQARCLTPHYLEPIEQEISDLLPRSTVGRFNVKQLLRADPKTRMETHQIAIEAGIYDSETAAREEGYAPGSVDYAPVAPAPPAAIPSILPADARTALVDLRCPRCGRLNGRASGYAEVTCKRCGQMVTAA
jgi:HK97 family phage portal protein